MMLRTGTIRRTAAHSAAIAAACMMLGASPTLAARCGNGPGGFQSWRQDFKSEARARGISERTLSRALGNVSYDSRVIRLDRSQRSFKLSFDAFYRRRVGSQLIASSRTKLRQHAALLDRIERRFGVPREILVSIWGLETNFGRDRTGKYSIIQAIATLAYDCRRSEFFTNHLMAALRIVQKGDMSPQQLRGGWAGEIGQVQFLPGSYDKYAVDFDGNGHRDLVHSSADVLASTANFLRAHGWTKGAPWGPGTHNYAVLKEWNRADVYARTIAVMAEKLQR